MTSECKCKSCVSACHKKPGWFLPGEAEVAAELLGLTLEEFFAKHLGVDYWVGDDGDTYVLAPVTVRGVAGEEYPSDPLGGCSFLDGSDCCMIYSARPYECRELIHTDGHRAVVDRHQTVAVAWENHQEQIGKLLADVGIAVVSNLQSV